MRRVARGRPSRAEGIAGEIVLVDCGSGQEEAALLRDVPADRYVLLPENRGYSGGVNAGLAQARGSVSSSPTPTSSSLAGSVRRLLEAIAEPRVGAAAPLSTWDAEGRVRLPPGCAPGLFRDAAQLLSGLSPALDRRRFASFARETLRLWERGGRAPHLSGAVLAARREVFDASGRFDERFPFEYEETEWEDRVRSKGFDLRFVPEARVRHLWAVSASRNPETGARRAASERLYRLRRYGRAATALLERAARFRRPRASRVPAFRAAGRGPCRRRARSLAEPVGTSVRGRGLVAGVPPAGRSASRLASGLWYLTIFRKADGRPLETFVWETGGMSFEIREATADDAPGIRRLFARVFGVEMPAEEWEWKFERNPDGWFGIVAVLGGEIVGNYAGWGMRFRLDGEERLLYSVGDVATDPAVRAIGARRGVYRSMTDAFYETVAARGVPFCFGFPNARALEISNRIVGTRHALPDPGTARAL